MSARISVAACLLVTACASPDDVDVGTLVEEVDGDAPYADQYGCGENHCVGRPGRHCYDLAPQITAPIDQLYSCEALRHDLSPTVDAQGNVICIREATAAAEGCCGSLEAAEHAVLTGTNFARGDLRPSVIDCFTDPNGNPLPNCPTPEQFCNGGGFAPDGNEIDFAANAGYIHVGPCSGEHKVAYLPAFLSSDAPSGLGYDGELVVLPEAGRLQLGISGRYSLAAVVRLDASSPLCTEGGLCSGAQVLGGLSDGSVYSRLYDLYTACYGPAGLGTVFGPPKTGCAHLPFVDVIGIHGFGWYEVPNLPAGTYAVVSASLGIGPFHGHSTIDTYAYYGNGGMQRYPGCLVNPGGLAGNLTAAPEQCKIEAGAGHCTTTIDWLATGNLRMAAVFLRHTGQQVAAGLSSPDPAFGGGIVLPWIGAQDYTFDLRQCGFAPNMSDCGSATGPILDTVVVRGVPVCGNGECQAGESCSSCTADCGECCQPSCPEGTCGWQADGCGGSAWCGECEGCPGPCEGGWVWSGDCQCHSCWEWYQYCWWNPWEPSCADAGSWCGFW